MQNTLLSTNYLLSLNVILLLTVMWCYRQSSATITQRWQLFGGLVAWLAVVILLVARGSLFTPSTTSWTVFASLLAVVGVSGALALFTPVGKQFLTMPTSLLLLPQGVRALFGAGFLIEGINSEIPGTFATLDGLTHITSAVLALMTATLLPRNAVGRGAVWLATIFGLSDIVVVAAGISFVLLAEIGPYHNVFYAAFYAAPIFIALHLLTIRQLLEHRAEGPSAPGFSPELAQSPG